MIMIQTFIATIAFGIALIAFCAGAALTLWATSSNNTVDVAAAKLSGYFVMILAVAALVGTSYYIAIGVLNGSSSLPQSTGQWGPKSMQQHKMNKQYGDSKTNKTNKQ
jgi:hypothetical protein